MWGSLKRIATTDATQQCIPAHTAEGLSKGFRHFSLPLEAALHNLPSTSATCTLRHLAPAHACRLRKHSDPGCGSQDGSENACINILLHITDPQVV